MLKIDRAVKPCLNSVLMLMVIIGNVICKETRQTQLLKQPRETNPFNFVRLLIMRLVYGFAVMMGFEESLTEVANGAFVPPGVDDDYGGLDYSRDSDYAYSDNDDYY
ncbi:uncharacterized protein LOC128999122 [Macrosteles quadrilineatus]|uniref:uncharacterized protein LOC128999122 n=1 Tax=Macrosteles quadrilineatus TaxID=74068 RepID=UPI0023E2774C|nr:uncharacterized protein LOC128999122 [Macrosteles quadrilineatus]